MQTPTETELARALESLRFWWRRLLTQALSGQLPKDKGEPQ
jgi:hypothetical protein